ncbi:MAG TPA: methyltransferase [Steroidobacter sp.]|jgi:hypothetical protein|nr:methyltransferase [Steroidobacteraceae bacterium]HLS81487.1 methyltransferase [Steroidobacter sp.]
MSQEHIPPQRLIWRLSLGFANTAVLHALVKTGVIEQMRHQSRTLPELAQTCRLNPDVLYRVLRFATELGVLAYNGSQYSLTETGTLLLRDTPGSLYMGLLLVGSEPWQRAWQNLAHSLATGEAAFDPIMGDPFFEYLDKHPEYGTPYNEWMTISTTLAASAITEAYDFTPFKSVCDIGGGQGVLLKNILTANPHLRGILYDQDTVVKDHVLADLSERVEIQTGSFFERTPSADVLLMKSVLHDWSDEKCQLILSRCRRAMRPSSRLLIVEMVIASPTDLMGAFYDLHMQVLLGGKERTAQEFSALLQSAGMKLNRIIPTKSPMNIIEASL